MPADRAENPAARYVVSVRPGRRSHGGTAEKAVLGVAGVEIKGAGNPARVLIEARPEAVAELRRRHGEELVIEPEVLHRPTSDPAADPDAGGLATMGAPRGE